LFCVERQKRRRQKTRTEDFLTAKAPSTPREEFFIGREDFLTAKSAKERERKRKRKRRGFEQKVTKGAKWRDFQADL
jgi:hypothetical protein